jgi:hypothetical protein
MKVGHVNLVEHPKRDSFGSNKHADDETKGALDGVVWGDIVNTINAQLPAGYKVEIEIIHPDGWKWNGEKKDTGATT